MKKLFCLIIALLLCTSFVLAEAPISYQDVLSGNNPIPDIAERVRPAVVSIHVTQESWDATTRISSENELSSGSGCYILQNEETGYILTNYHIVEGGDGFTISWLNGDENEAELVGYDDGTDIAVLSFSGAAPESVQPIPFGDSDALQIGELVISIGNPGIIGQDTMFYGTVTAGIVSGIGQISTSDNFSRSASVIQTDAALNFGNSGGALLNAQGELVGIPTIKYIIYYEGLGFCVPMNSIRDYIDQIIQTGHVQRPMLGITVIDVDGPETPMKNYPPIGLQIMTIDENGPAKDSGLQVGDIICEANGNRVHNFMELTRYIDACQPGDGLELKVYRYYDQNNAPLDKFQEVFATIYPEILN
ncbi:MAG: trypsin-like peptidase domain-containing protein [Christensenellales bacterium]|nr:trypsin-like peptidase domain-containing protein [Christensenellales bacterium]